MFSEHEVVLSKDDGLYDVLVDTLVHTKIFVI